MAQKLTIDNGKITYRKLMVSKEDATNVASNLGFDEDGKSWYVYLTGSLRQHIKKLPYARMQVYQPMRKVLKTVRGKAEMVDQPQILNYVFVLATLEQVESFRLAENVTPVYAHHEKGVIIANDKKYLVVPKSQMHSLMIVAQGLEKEVVFETPNDQLLEKGDRVRVVAGRFKGVEGVLLTNQGSHKGGRVFVSIAHHFGTSTAHIPDSHLQVLEFSRSSNHFSRKLAAIENVLNGDIAQVKQGKALTAEQRAELHFFLFRYRNLGGLSHVSNTKMTVCRYIALRLIGAHGEAEQIYADYQSAVTADPKLRRASKRWPTAQKYINQWMTKVQPLYPETMSYVS